MSSCQGGQWEIRPNPPLNVWVTTLSIKLQAEPSGALSVSPPASDHFTPTLSCEGANSQSWFGE